MKIFKGKPTAALITIVVVLGIIIGVINACGVKLTFIENIVNTIATPLQRVITSAGEKTNNFFGYFSEVDSIRAENKKLKEKNAELAEKLKNAELAEKENESLRSMLGLKKVLAEYDLECASLAARDPGNWFGTLTVDKGSSSGIKVDQTVISSEKTLVGRVSEVGSNWAKIVTVTDPDCSVGALIERSGEYGVTEGNAVLEQEGKCRLSYISKNTNLLVGDTVVTSGLGGIFPAGINIGKVSAIKTDMQGISQYAEIIPSCELDRLNTVFIIKNDFGGAE